MVPKVDNTLKVLGSELMYSFEQNPNFDAKGLFLDNAHFPDSVYLI